jgi:GDPmannose 4,6-dehydratase
VVASGETHSVKDMIEIVADLVGVRWRGRIVENTSLLKRESQELCGDSSRLRQLTGWHPRTSFRDLVGILVRAARERETTR